MWQAILDKALTAMIVCDRLKVTYPDGEARIYGPETGESMHIAIADHKMLRRLVMTPELALGEAYMDGTLSLQEGDLASLAKLLIRNYESGRPPLWMKAADLARFHTRRILQHNAPDMARRNVAHHYDISDDLYRLFLDPDMQYSCAYFTHDSMRLEDAQAAKKAHIARKLCLEPGMHVLDIGCGWGGMALTLARDYGVHVTGITLSENQLDTARARAEAAGLSGQVRFELRDYRHATDNFDRIVSVGMFEHVGYRHATAYFAQVENLLAPDGVALIHTISHQGHNFTDSSWIRRYIFPGYSLPSLAEITRAVERTDLFLGDIEPWRIHYAKTLEAWLVRVEQNAEAITKMFDARFLRMWRYYLTSMAVSFRHSRLLVYQIQVARRMGTLPLTRDYIYNEPDKGEAHK